MFHLCLIDQHRRTFTPSISHTCLSETVSGADTGQPCTVQSITELTHPDRLLTTTFTPTDNLDLATVSLMSYAVCVSSSDMVM